MNIISITAAFLSGVLSSMGLGGGTILVVYLINYAGFSQAAAQGINLLCFIPTALGATFIYAKNKLTDKKTVLPLIWWALVGSIAGLLLLSRLPDEILRKLFGGFLILLGLRELFSKSRNE